MPSKQAFVSLFLTEIVTCCRVGFILLPRILFFPHHLPPRFLMDVGKFSCPSIQHREGRSALSSGVI